MTKIILGQHSVYTIDDKTFHTSDAFCLPKYNIFGVATSNHYYDWYPIGARDVELAFDLIRHIPSESFLKLNGLVLLQNLLQAVHEGFCQIDLPTHVAGILPHEPDYFRDRLNHPYAKPTIRIILLQQEGQRLSLASVGNFLVYKIDQRDTELLFGTEWDTGKWAVIDFDLFLHPVIEAGQEEMPEIYSWETHLKPGDIIIVGTPLTPILKAKLDQWVGNYSLEGLNHHLMTTVKSTFEPSGTFGYSIAWAISCVEE